MLNCSDPCDECKPKAPKMSCNVSCCQHFKSDCQVCEHETQKTQNNQCNCPKCRDKINCKLICEKKAPEFSCNKKEEKKISCKISCEKEKKAKRCEICGQLIFPNHE